MPNQSTVDPSPPIASVIDDTRTTTAEQLDAVASAVRDSALRLPGGDRVTGVVDAGADGIAAGADYVRTHDGRRILEDVTGFVSSNPRLALALAVACGFALGRALSRD